jgi:hypothetical protein
MTGTRLRRGAMLAFAIAGFLQPARAEAPVSDAQRDQHLAKIITVIVVVDALAERCNSFAPDGRERREAALKKWRTDNRVDALQAVLDPLLTRLPETSAKIAALRNQAAKHAAKLMDDKPGVCAAFAVELRDKDLAIGDKVVAVLPALTQAPKGQSSPLAKTSPRPEHDAKPASVYTILQLSTLAEAAMSSFTAPEGQVRAKSATRKPQSARRPWKSSTSLACAPGSSIAITWKTGAANTSPPTGCAATPLSTRLPKTVSKLWKAPKR